MSSQSARSRSCTRAWPTSTPLSTSSVQFMCFERAISVTSSVLSTWYYRPTARDGSWWRVVMTGIRTTVLTLTNHAPRSPVWPYRPISRCSTDSERRHRGCHLPNEVENIDSTLDITCTLHWDPPQKIAPPLGIWHFCSKICGTSSSKSVSIIDCLMLPYSMASRGPSTAGQSNKSKSTVCCSLWPVFPVKLWCQWYCEMRCW